jgi:hypothetical protein
LSLVNLAIGIIAMLALAILQTALVVGKVEYEQSLRPVLTASAVIGLWLVVNGALASRGSHRERTVPRGLAWVSLISGIGLILTDVGFWIGEKSIPSLQSVDWLLSPESSSGRFGSEKLLLSERVTPPRSRIG